MTNVSLHWFARLPRRFFLSLGLGVGLLTLGAIAPPPSPTQDTAATPLEQPTPLVAGYSSLLTAVDAPEALWQASSTAASTPPTPEQSIVFYTPAQDCTAFQTETRSVAADKAVPQIVHYLLTEQTGHLLDFELAGYRLQPGENGNTLTIDFRRAPGAERQFVSLSVCEQLALFGSLRKTLVENASLNIDAVQFTERGQLLQL